MSEGRLLKGESMGDHYSLSVHFGSGDKGKRRMDRMLELMKVKNFHSKAECIQYCLDQMCDLVLQDNPSPVNGVHEGQ